MSNKYNNDDNDNNSNSQFAVSVETNLQRKQHRLQGIITNTVPQLTLVFV